MIDGAVAHKDAYDAVAQPFVYAPSGMSAAAPQDGGRENGEPQDGNRQNGEQGKADQRNGAGRT